MDVFNIVAQFIFYVSLAISLGMIVFYLIKRHLVRKKARKEIEDEENEIGHTE